jgi:hypothetical protein
MGERLSIQGRFSLDSSPDQSGNGLPEKVAISGSGVAIKTTINQQLASLPKMSRAGLIALWEQVFDTPANRALRRELMIPILAYRLQELAFGGLKSSTEKRLKEIAAGSQTRRGDAAFRRPRPGTQFVREWQGKLHEVATLADGYEYNNRTFASLSEVAREITGTRWSGPAFFGLRAPKKGQAA